MPELFLLAVFRLVNRFPGRVSGGLQAGMQKALLSRIGTAAGPLALAIRVLICQWAGISYQEDIKQLLLQREDIAGFQWRPSPLYAAPSKRLHFFNPLFDVAVIRTVLERSMGSLAPVH